jgi:MFS family permease
MIPTASQTKINMKFSTSRFRAISLATILLSIPSVLGGGGIALSSKRYQIAYVRSSQHQRRPVHEKNGFGLKRNLLIHDALLGLRGGATKKPAQTNNKIVKSNMIENRPEKTDPKLLMMIRILFVAFYGSLGSLMPYLPVYYHSLGHGGAAIGLLGAVKPLTTFLVAPLWGIMSDRTQNPSFILQFTFVTSLLLQLLFCVRDEVKYLVTLGFLAAFFNAPVKSLIDSMVMDNLSEDDRAQQYGKLRLWGQLGFGLGSGTVGWLLSHRPQSTNPTFAPAPHPFREEITHAGMEAAAAAAASEELTETALETLNQMLNSAIDYLKNIKGYHIAFFTHGLLSIPAFLAMRAFNRFEKKKDILSSKINAALTTSKKNTDVVEKVREGPKILEGLNLLFHNTDALLFFFLVFVVGTSSGCIENFAYVRIREVGGSGKEMGLSRLISSAAGAPMFWFSGPLTQKLGADRVLVLSLLSYVARFLIYAFMKNPYQGLPAEALRGITFGAFWSTGTIFAHRISPKGMGATMLMFLNAMYGGLGQSIGAIIGGKLQSKFGTVKTFVYAGIFDFVFACAAYTYLSLKKDSSFRNPQPMVKKD